MILNELRPPRGATQNKKRLGRGESSGLGKTAGKGHKGQKSRAGGYHKVGFEGGQMPLARRLPKRGFTNVFRTEYAVVNLSDLNKLDAKISDVNFEVLKTHGLVRKEYGGLKVLGNGELKRAFTITAKKFSQSAKDKIAKAGGKAVELK